MSSETRTPKFTPAKPAAVIEVATDGSEAAGELAKILGKLVTVNPNVHVSVITPRPTREVDPDGE